MSTMTVAEAIAKARSLWGDESHIWTEPSELIGTWYYVGLRKWNPQIKCHTLHTMGVGPTWDAAFEDAKIQEIRTTRDREERRDARKRRARR